jgi:hypothetical protein
MNASDVVGAAVKPPPSHPYDKVAEYIRKLTSRRIRFRPRTRAIFVNIHVPEHVNGGVLGW